MGTTNSPEHSAKLKEFEERFAQLRKELTRLRQQDAKCTVTNHTFRRPDFSPVTLSELFGTHDELIVIHNMGERCQYCALWADGFIGFARHIQSRCALALSSPDSPASLSKQIELRGWNFPVVSHAGTTFARDMGYEPEPGKFWPGLSSFQRAPDGTITRFSSGQFGPGDEFCPIWHILEMLPRGVNGWEPTKPG